MSKVGSSADRSARNISSSTAASSPARAPIRTAPAMRPGRGSGRQVLERTLRIPQDGRAAFRRGLVSAAELNGAKKSLMLRIRTAPQAQLGAAGRSSAFEGLVP